MHDELGFASFRREAPPAQQCRDTIDAGALLGRPARLEALHEYAAPAPPRGHGDLDAVRQRLERGGESRSEEHVLFLRFLGDGAEQAPRASRPATSGECRDDELRLLENGQVRSHGVRMEADAPGERVHRLGYLARAEVVEQARAGRVGERSMVPRFPVHERSIDGPDSHGIGEFPYGGSGPATMRRDQISLMIDV